MRKTCGGEKWGRFSRACLECERRGGYRTPKSVFCLLWGSSRRNVERPGVQSGKEAAPNSPAPRPRSSGGGPGVENGDEQGTPRGGKQEGGSSELTGTQTSIIRGRARGGKWRGAGGGPGVGSGDAQRLSAHARAQHSPTRRTQPHNNAHRRARPWLQVGHNP